MPILAYYVKPGAYHRACYPRRETQPRCDLYRVVHNVMLTRLWTRTQLFQVWSAASILAVLRLVEHELEADDLAHRLGI